MKLLSVVLCSALLLAQQPTRSKSKAETLFETGMNYLEGTGQTRDPMRGVSNIRDAARLGYVPALTAVEYAESQSQAAEWCRKAAESGDALGQWCIGRMYFFGQGVTTDWTEAERWLRKAAGQGNPYAAYMLGLIKQDRDPKSAPQWFEQAAQAGLPQAQLKLAFLYSDGRYLPHDKYRAYVWILVAAESNANPPGQAGTLEGDLGTAMVDKAKTEARELARTVSRTANAHGCTGWDGEFDPTPAFPPLKVQKFCR